MPEKAREGTEGHKPSCVSNETFLAVHNGAKVALSYQHSEDAVDDHDAYEVGPQLLHTFHLLHEPVCVIVVR